MALSKAQTKDLNFILRDLRDVGTPGQRIPLEQITRTLAHFVEHNGHPAVARADG
jgi:hypothetical protein